MSFGMKSNSCYNKVKNTNSRGKSAKVLYPSTHPYRQQQQHQQVTKRTTPEQQFRYLFLSCVILISEKQIS